jgi:hypothetical protein
MRYTSFMKVVRGRLRGVALIWLLCQVVSVYAVLPMACCALHDRAGRRTQVEHAPHERPEATSKADCASHQPSAAETVPLPEPCRMRGECCRSTRGMLPIFANLAVLSDQLLSSIEDPVLKIDATAPLRSIRLATPPEAPPPRL